MASACLERDKEAAACRLAHASAGACIFVLLLAIALMPGRVAQLMTEPPSWVPEALQATLPDQLTPWPLGFAILAGSVIGGALPTWVCTYLVSPTLPANAAAAVKRDGSLFASELTAVTLLCMWAHAMGPSVCPSNSNHFLLDSLLDVARCRAARR
jgi:hypothetical protein